MSKRITIGPNGVFEQVEVEQSDDVFWVNNDTKPHWPVPWCYGLRVDPGNTTGAFQTYPGAQPNLPQKIVYQDALGEQTGVILVYNDFLVIPGPYTTSASQPQPIPLTSGGKSPYNTSASANVPKWLTFAEAIPDS